MRIAFDPATLHQSKRGSITGVVYFDFGGAEAFPIEGWNDFVVVIAGWWLSAMAQVAGGSGEAQLRFMDGPYWVTVRAQDPARLQLHCIEDRRGAGEVFQAEVDTEELASEMRRFARDVAQACAAAGFDSPELAELRRYLPN
jgi:hypothetical protein